MNFDVLAPHYRWMEFVAAGEKLQRCRVAFLGRVMDAKKVLILGDGNGRFLLECRRKLPHAKITSVDASARMLALARRRLAKNDANNKPVDFICADALAWTPPENYFDLVVTHFFLDCFRSEQVEALIRKLARASAPRANWLVADFQTAAKGIPRQRSRAILWMLYKFFRVATRLSAAELTPPDVFLQRNGFELHERQVHDWGLLHSDCWQREE
jgi:ubiquinone/menaquinone biosynthesis C-methylase UbiE